MVDGHLFLLKCTTQQEEMAQAEAPTYAGHFCQDAPVQSYFLSIEKVIFKSRQETAATLLLLMPSKCERQSSTIWRQPKACEEKTPP